MASALNDSSSAIRHDDVSFSGTLAPIDEVVSLLVETKLTKHQYLVIKDFAIIDHALLSIGEGAFRRSGRS